MADNSMSMESSQAITPKNSSTNKFLIGCGVLVLLSICGCVLGTVGFFVYFGREPETLAVDYSIPYSVTKGERFELVLTLTNTGHSDLLVGDIDLDEVFGGSILDGSTTVSTDPPMDRDFSISGIKSFAYNRTIPAGESRQVTFFLEAVEVGEFGGSIGIYVGNQAKRIIYVGITITGK